MKFCAKYNKMGFGNTNDVLVFSSKEARDEFVTKHESCAEAITVKKATYWAANYSLTDNREIKPRPFSPEYWGIVNLRTDCGEDYLGDLEVCTENWSNAPRFYA